MVGLIIFTFIIIHTAPGDPATILAGEYADPDIMQMTRQRYGLDKPIYEQLFLYFGNILQGEFGYSIAYKVPVVPLIAERLPATLLLMITSISIATTIGIVLGVTASRKPYSVKDNVISAGSIVLWAIPLFWLGQIMLIVFSVQLHLFPVQGMYSSTNITDPLQKSLDLLRHLALPALTLASVITALITRMTRTGMLEVLSEDYITLARSKGASERTILFKHGLRNALLPVVTVVGLQFGATFASAVVVETVFGWPGLGRLMISSIFNRDYPTLMGLFIVSGVWIILVNLVTDIMYAVLDPRIRRR
jgi:peptide/nickel transport system permease protein